MGAVISQTEMRTGARIADRAFKAVEAVLAALLLGMVVMVFGNVVLRYVFNSGIVVSEVKLKRAAS